MSFAQLIANLKKYKVLSALFISQCLITLITAFGSFLFLYNYIDHRSQATLTQQKAEVYKLLSPVQESLRAWKQMQADEPLKNELDHLNAIAKPTSISVETLTPLQATELMGEDTTTIFPQTPLTYETSYVVSRVPKLNIYSEIAQVKGTAIVLLAFSILSLLSTLYFILKYIYYPIQAIVSGVKLESLLEDGSPAKAEIRTLLKKMLDYQTIKVDMAVSEQRSLMAAQVAHDIRSPLAALEMLSSTLDELHEDKRTILKNSIYRIKDIANSLTRTSKTDSESAPDTNKTNHFPIEAESTTVELLSTLIDSIVSESRVKFRGQLGLNIDFKNDASTYGLFSRIQSSDFKRIISNLINNAVESLPHGTGTVAISLISAGDSNLITIRDSGTGISDEVLAQLGKRGATFNKIGGSGLGLFHAFTKVESWNGKLNITSQVGVGTILTISLPKQPAPSWFANNIDSIAVKTIVTVDDDQSIHQVWRERFRAVKNESINVVNLGSIKDLRTFYRERFDELDDALFLIDFEFSGLKESGLDTITELGLQNQALLVTSRYEDAEIRNRCSVQGVKIVPKAMSAVVPVH